MIVAPTPEQQQVINYPLLPLRVTAGAGTGKTTTMALRLAALIRREGLEPEEALGITFTNKAAEELEVTTYHGFAYAVLAEFGPLVGVERGVQVITPGYTRQLLRDALGAAPRRTLDLTAPGFRVDELVVLAGQLGDHLCDPGTLADAAPGDEVQAARAEMAEVLAAYAARKARLGAIDYADLITLAHRLLSTHPAVAERLRVRYRVVLLDEYQDTNPAQRELLRLVFGGGFPVTAVGDADQTIYEWRGASLQNFEDFPAHFPRADGTPAQTLYLAHNRRSGRRIVDLANLVRGQIAARSGLERLEALPEAPPGEVATAWFHNALDEARWIAAEAVRLHEGGEVAWRDMGILFRRHASIALVRDSLEQAGVPVEVASLGGLLDVPEVADLHAWLRIVGRPDDTAALMRVLLGARYHLGLGDLAPVAARPTRRPPGEPADPEAPARGMLEGLDRLEDASALSAEAARRLAAFRTTYRRLLEAAQGLSLVDLCRRILDETGAWPEVEALGDAARLSARLNLYRFLDLAEGWSPLEGAPSLDAFLDYLDLLGEDRASEELDTARVSGEDAVALLTVHRAKGLEWPVVFVPALAKGTFPGSPHTLEDPLAQPRFLPYEMRLDAGYLPALPDDPEERKALVRGRHQDQEWRTAYVAVTRAKHRLVLTGAYWYTEKRPKEPSPLLDLAAQVDGVERLLVTEAPGEPPAALRFDPDDGSDPDPLFPQGPRAALRLAVADPSFPTRLAAEAGRGAAFTAAAARLAEALDGLPQAHPLPAAGPAFRTTVTALVTFASCPLRFHWSAADRLPRRPSAARRRGVDIHRRIELHHRGGLPPEEAAESLYDLPAGETRRGADPFAAFRASRFSAATPVMVEAPFELQLEGLRLAGRIDAVYGPEPGLWEVVDFKSGRRRPDPALLVQLEAYAVAVHEAGFSGAPERTRVTFAYLGGKALEEVTEEVDAAWREAARTRLASLLAAAAAGERTPSPSEACRTCDFTRFCAAGAAWVAAHPLKPPGPRPRRAPGSPARR
ncbi:MAG: ATP-dependent helicase [Acidimicrobiia bacterium]|nr:ATP-dependent helicase [Acidimicrobiia bacterium]